MSNWTDAHQQVTPLQASVYSAIAQELQRHLFVAAYGIMATHSCILAWKIPWTEEPGGLQSMELQRVECDLTHTTYMFN